MIYVSSPKLCLSLVANIAFALGTVFAESTPPVPANKLPPEVWERAVRHAKEKQYGFRYWEIGLAKQSWRAIRHEDSRIRKLTPFR